MLVNQKMKTDGNMFEATINREKLQAIIGAMSDADVARFLYCQEIAGTYLAVGKFEDMLVSAMHMCDRVKVQKKLGRDEDRWTRSLQKRALLRGSTLGSLITILDRHNIDQADIAYLRWIKDKRDYFVHRLFHDGAWPGDLSEEDCKFMRRRLLAIQLWLERGVRNIWLIFERAGFVELNRFADGSLLAMNTGVFDAIQEDAEKWDQNDRL